MWSRKKNASLLVRLTDIVLVRIIKCVHHRRLGGPLVLVHGLAQLLHVAMGLELEDVEQVLQELVVMDGELECGNSLDARQCPG